MNNLNIDNKVYTSMIKKLLDKGVLCIIGGSKCGKSRMAIEIINRLHGDDGKAIILDKIPGVYIAKKYIISGLTKPIIFLKSVSGLDLLELEHICRDNYLIMTSPVSTPGLLYNRFISFDNDYEEIKNFEDRLWNCIPVIIENKKLSDGNVYVIDAFDVVCKDSVINKHYFCRYKEDKNIFEEDFSGVNGKYLYFD